MILDPIGKAVSHPAFGISFINISKQWSTKFGTTFTLRKNNKKLYEAKRTK